MTTDTLTCVCVLVCVGVCWGVLVCVGVCMLVCVALAVSVCGCVRVWLWANEAHVCLIQSDRPRLDVNGPRPKTTERMNELLVQLMTHEINRIVAWHNPANDPQLRLPGQEARDAPAPNAACVAA